MKTSKWLASRRARDPKLVTLANWKPGVVRRPRLLLKVMRNDNVYGGIFS